jgi:O-antigen ligase
MRLKSLYNYSFLVLASFPLFSLMYFSFVAAFWCLLSIVVLIREKTYLLVSKKDIRNLCIFSLYYVFLIINFILSSFDHRLMKFLETDLLMLLFPLFIILNKSFLSAKVVENTLLVFFSSNVILSIVCWVKVLNIGYFKLLEENNYYQPVFRNLFSETTNIHLPYLGLLFVFSIFIGLFFVIKKKSKFFIRILIILGCLILIISILTFSARTSLLTIIIIGLFVIYSKIKSIFIKITLSSILIAFSLFLVFNTPIKKRVEELMNTKLELPSAKLNDKSSLVNFRYGIYYCALNVLEENIILGVGKNNIFEEMNTCYETFTYSNFDDFKNRDYNTHNQYLDIIISYGIFGLLILFTSLFFGWFTTENELYRIFLAIFFLALLTENVLDRQLGVVFFSFFNSLFFSKRSKI